MLELLRLKDLLGLSLDELRDVVTAEEARGAMRARWHEGDPSHQRRRQILEEAGEHIASQLALTCRRREKLDELERELQARRAKLHVRLRELDGDQPPDEGDHPPDS